MENQLPRLGYGRRYAANSLKGLYMKSISASSSLRFAALEARSQINETTIKTIAISLPLFLPCLGCDNLGASDKKPASTAPPSVNDPSTGSTETVTKRDSLTSNDILTVKDGKISVGRPEVTEDLEREICKSLNHRRKMRASIKRNSGPNRGIQQMQDELDLLTRGFMSRYSLTQAEIDEILKKGDANAWE